MKVDPARLDEVFAIAVAETAPIARQKLLDQECQDDSELRQRAEALLAAYDAAGSLLELPEDDATCPFVSLTERPGSTIGRYTLLEQIGEGGFGVVFMAEQEQPVRRRVALKVIKLGMDTKQVVARFEAERQALAMMDHPNIAKVFDAGSTETGRPYFVMELVRGVPITEYCDQARLTTDERLALFQSVCAAVQHAHQKGIIHRDLKPSNVLVTLHDDKAVPKVIDFGVAKATQARLTERTLFTEFRQMIGTPTYMSPEQAHMSGLDIDTRSDVYSLGVLLYELLTGSTPVESKQFSGASYDDVRRLICEVDPPSPSARLSTLSDEQRTSLAQQRHCEPAQLVVNLRSDLDWIVMKCLEKDRTRRYESASALAQDLQRYLEGQPIEARPPTRRYRLGKFIRRNKTGVIVGTAIVAALVAGVMLASLGFLQARRQALIARTQATRSEEVTRFLQDMLAAAGPSVALGRDTTLLREILDNTAQRVSTDLRDQPAIQAELWSTLGNTYESIGDSQRALKMHQWAVENYREAYGDENVDLAIALTTLGVVQRLAGEPRLGKANVSQGLEIARKSGNKRAIARCLTNYASSFGSYHSVEESIPLLREALAITEQLGDEPLFQARIESSLGSHLGRPGSWEESEALLLKSLATNRKHYPPDHPEVIFALYKLSMNLLRQLKLVEAEAVAQEGYDLAHKVYPTETEMPHSLALVLFMIHMQGENWNQAEAVCQQLSAFAPSDASSFSLWGDYYAWRGELLMAADHYSRAASLDPEEPQHSFDIATALLFSGRVEEYRAFCHEYLTRSTDTQSFGTADMSAKAALLLPVEGADFQLACDLADFASTCDSPRMLVPYMQLVKALAEYRRERFVSAIDWARRTVDSDATSPECKAAALCIQACSHVELKQLELAKATLADADQVTSDIRDTKYFFMWRDWTIIELLRREASELIEKSAPAPQL